MINLKKLVNKIIDYIAERIAVNISKKNNYNMKCFECDEKDCESYPYDSKGRLKDE